MEKELQADKDFQRIRKDIETWERQYKYFSLVNNRLLYKGRVVLPRKSHIIPTLMYKYHDAEMGGHSGEVKTYLRLATNWFWVGMMNNVKLYVQQWQICQQQKSSQQLPARLLQPLPIPDLVWEEISLDFVEWLPLSQGVNAVLVVVDRLSKYAYFYWIKAPI